MRPTTLTVLTSVSLLWEAIFTFGIAETIQSNLYKYLKLKWLSGMSNVSYLLNAYENIYDTYNNITILKSFVRLYVFPFVSSG